MSVFPVLIDIRYVALSAAAAAVHRLMGAEDAS